MAIGCAVGLWLFGVVFSWFVSGPIGGSLAFVLMVMALPVMPILGMPAAGGAARLLIAIASSAVLWWDSDYGLAQRADCCSAFLFWVRSNYTVT